MASMHPAIDYIAWGAKQMMSSTQWQGFAVLLVYAVLGWAYCGLLIAISRRFIPLDQVLLLHAVAAPLGFALLAFDYSRRFAFTGPLTTAATFATVVFLLDLLIVALVFERSFAMFASLIGMWIPLASIFAVSWLICLVTGLRRPA
jgi:hypothetical protein